jgi:hypothetical protein
MFFNKELGLYYKRNKSDFSALYTQLRLSYVFINCCRSLKQMTHLAYYGRE